MLRFSPFVLISYINMGHRTYFLHKYGNLSRNVIYEHKINHLCIRPVKAPFLYCACITFNVETREARKYFCMFLFNCMPFVETITCIKTF